MPAVVGSFIVPDTAVSPFTVRSPLLRSVKGVIMFTAGMFPAPAFDQSKFYQSIGVASKEGNFQGNVMTFGAENVFTLHWTNTTSCVLTTNTVVAKMEILQWLSNGWRLNPIDNTQEGVIIYYLAFTGRSLKAIAGEYDLDGSAGAQSLTGFGFEPQLFFNLAAQPGSAPSTDGTSVTCGAADADLNQWSRAMWVEHIGHAGPLQSWTRELAVDDRVTVGVTAAFPGDTGSVAQEATLDSMDSDGVTFDVISSLGDITKHVFLAMRDDDPDSGFAVVAKAEGDETVSGLAFTPQAVFACAGQIDWGNGVYAGSEIGYGAAQVDGVGGGSGSSGSGMFPTVDDDFNRADGGLGSDWDSLAIDPPAIDTNQVTADGALIAGAVWDVATFTDLSAVIEISADASDSDVAYLGLRADATNGTTLLSTGYWLRAIPSSGDLHVSLYDQFPGVGTLLDTATIGSVALPCRIAIVAVGTLIRCYIDDGGSGTLKVLEATDATWAGPDSVAFFLTTDMVLDNFGVEASPTVTDPVPAVADAASIWNFAGDTDAEPRRTQGEALMRRDLNDAETQTSITQVVSWNADGIDLDNEIEGVNLDMQPTGLILAHTSPGKRRGGLPVVGVG